MAGVRCYGYYSNVSRGKRKETEDDGVPSILEAEKSSLKIHTQLSQLPKK